MRRQYDRRHLRIGVPKDTNHASDERDELIKVLQAACEDHIRERNRLGDELETTAAKLADCWDLLDDIATGWLGTDSGGPDECAKLLLRRQQAPGRKT